MATTTLSRSYPRRAKLREGDEATLRLMADRDRDVLVAFARHLPADDLLFLRMDITEPPVVDEWIANIKAGRTITILAEVHDKLAGYASLHYNEVLWTRHVGEIRVAVAPKFRRQLLGQILADEVFAIARQLGLKKITAHMTTDQKGARATFERIGFRPEALLADHVIDNEGRTHDMLIMSYDIDGFND